VGFWTEKIFVADLSDECHSTSVAGTSILMMKIDKATEDNMISEIDILNESHNMSHLRQQPVAVSPGSSERKKSWPPSISLVETHEVVNPDRQ
jgi:hypothetical protein